MLFAAVHVAKVINYCVKIAPLRHAVLHSYRKNMLLVQVPGFHPSTLLLTMSVLQCCSGAIITLVCVYSAWSPKLVA